MSTGTTENISSDAPTKDVKFSFMPEVHEQLAFVAASWNASGMVDMQSEMLKNISKAVVAEDIEAHRATAIQKLQNALSKVPADQRGDLQAKIDAVSTALNVTQIDTLTTEALRDIETAAQWANLDTNINTQQAGEDEQKFLADMMRWDKQADEYDEKWAKKGYYDAAYEKRKKEIEEQQKQYAPDSEEWRKLEEEKMKLRIAHDGNVAQQAAANNDQSTATEATTQQQEAQKKLEELQKHNNSKETEKASVKTRDKDNDVAASGRATFDDDEPIVAQQKAKYEEIKIGELSAPQFSGKKSPGNTGRTA